MKNVSNARIASIRSLEQFDNTHRLEQDLLNKLDRQERQQANEYVQGILRRKSYLDFIVSKFSSVEIERMDAFFKNILRLGIYDLMFMDSTPDYAAINESVEIAKSEISARSGDLANAILRKVQREMGNGALPTPDMEDRTELIATTFSHPAWMVERWVNRFGEREAFELMTANNQRPTYFLRANCLKTSPETFKLRMEKAGLEFEEHEWLPGYFRMKSLAEVRSRGWFEKGLCYVQDIAAGFAPFILDPVAGESVIDVCAAPGTKTLLLAELMENEGKLLAVDINPDRIYRIAENAERGGAKIVKIQRADATEERFKLADAVLLDAPCTGTGVLSKRADLRWRRTPEELNKAIEDQAKLLDAAANMVAKNGRLVYSTCSLEPEENMMQIEKFLEVYDNFELEDLDDYLPEEVLSDDLKSYQTFPHKHNCDGHFGVLLKRKF